MTEWNFDLTQAPRDGSHVILAMPDNKTLRSYWVKPKHDPEHWCMLSHKNVPVAWMLWPEHPFAETQRQQGEDGGEVAAVKVKDRLANATGVEPSPSNHFILEDCGSGA